MEHKLRMSRDHVLETVGDMVQYANSLCQDIEFSPEDAESGKVRIKCTVQMDISRR